MSVQASERDEAARTLFRDLIQTLDARRVVVVDESSTHLGMSTAYGRSPRGQRVYSSQRRNYGQNVSLIASLRLSGMDTGMVVEGAVNTAGFEAYVQQVLVPSLKPGDIVLLDNLICHKSRRVRGLVQARGCRLLFLPAYSPDFSPIEQAFSKIKNGLKRRAAMTLDSLFEAIRQALDSISPQDAIGFFIDAGFLSIDGV